MIRVCLHGAESTGKSVLAAQLQAQCGWPWIPEYGRQYCEEHGTDLTMADLLAIAEGQDAANRAAEALSPPVLLLDTDQLMTAAWAQMLFGAVPEVLLSYPKADLYLLFSPDVPWVEDGTRFFGTDAERARFATIAEAMLVRAGVPFTRIAGGWDERAAQARAAIAALLDAG
ncbi:ATP-binding protein [Novosphingobium album (ex Liu et al. 2023)]|uniref:ATP-binding protein n=1 Tax=Novosphingobium album (ex Liu et al. 2023) TaxID=3031130 RepID=A0ABT5WVT2_9SPHN|nr:ATP-binding protein [Novosphingobium album (ex Liu et al. 2023)]MDE8653976.1 ATP-binding protein [Novosphingobium album (ex Liu et al. 2023)]